MKEIRKHIDWSNFKENDIIIDLLGGKCKVLGRLGQVFARSGWYNFDAFADMKTIAEAKRAGWRFIQPGNRVQMTQEEVEQYLGNIEIVSKKKLKEFI